MGETARTAFRTTRAVVRELLLVPARSGTRMSRSTRFFVGHPAREVEMANANPGEAQIIAGGLAFLATRAGTVWKGIDHDRGSTVLASQWRSSHSLHSHGKVACGTMLRLR